MILLLLGGCLDELLESPYVLTPGLGEVRSVSPGTDGRLLAATSTGVYAIDTGGKPERVGEPALAVSAHPGRSYRLDTDGVQFTGRDGDGALHDDGSAAVDVLAGYDEIATLAPSRLALWPLDGSSPREVPLRGARAVALGPGGTYLVVTADTLLSVHDGVATPLAANLTDARAAATDAEGRVYVAQGEPTELWRVEPDGQLTNIAKWLGDVRDMHFGVGPFPPENLYLANGAGSVDYVRPP